MKTGKEKKFLMSRRDTLLAALWMMFLCVCCCVSARAGDDLAVLKKRMVSKAAGGGASAERAQRLIDSMRDNGSWPGVNYESKERAGWQTARHLNRVKRLARACYHEVSPPSGRRNVRQAALRSLDYWLQNDFRNPNWWWNQIGVPDDMADILLLLEPELKRQQMQKGLEILKRAKPGMTGQNLVWVTLITAKRGVLQEDAELVDSAFGRIEEEIRVTEKEGIQPDFSFHQHGPCPYNHGYGAGFASDCSRLAVLTRGTRFAFSPDKVRILTRYVLDGSRWITRGRWADYGANGRGITRKGAGDCGYLASVARNMLKLKAPKRGEFRQLLSRVKNDEPALAGNRHFWCSDFMTHHRPAYYASVRMYSTRTVNTDNPCNDEGLRSHHLADGCTYIVRTGDEYHNIMPVWDWQKIPGTTAAQRAELKGSPRRKGRTNFVGGVSDGPYGAAAFDMLTPRDDLRARKAWFFFDGAFVCLGAGITSPADRPVVTTMNQCLLQGGVTVRAGEVRQPEKGSHALQDVTWVHHDRIGYVFPGGSDAQLTNRAETGNWWRINHQYSKDTVKKDVFTLWLSHGSAPDGAAYSYVVVPDVASGELDDYASDPPVKILANTPELQSVLHRDRNILQTVFYKPGRLTADELELQADKPCIVQVRRTPSGLKLAVSDPTRKLQELHIRVNGRLPFGSGKNMQAELTLDLPGGMQAGSTAVRTLRKPE